MYLFGGPRSTLDVWMQNVLVVLETLYCSSSRHVPAKAKNPHILKTNGYTGILQVSLAAVFIYIDIDIILAASVWTLKSARNLRGLFSSLGLQLG